MNSFGSMPSVIIHIGNTNYSDVTANITKLARDGIILQVETHALFVYAHDILKTILLC